MDPLKSNRRMSLFRATDAYAVDAYAISRWLKGQRGDGLGAEIRRTAVESGGAIVAAAAAEPGGEDERRQLRRARSALIEARYYLYLARRFGLLDTRRYRSLTTRQDTAVREIESHLRAGRPALEPPPGR